MLYKQRQSAESESVITAARLKESREQRRVSKGYKIGLNKPYCKERLRRAE